MRVLQSQFTTRFARTVVLATLLGIGFTAGLDAAEDIPGTLCLEAEQRYIDLFGKPWAQEQGVSMVLMYKYHFCPAAITVSPGTTVRWVNVDKRTSHSVQVPQSGQPESDRIFPKEIIEMTFLTAGQHDYLCGPHWETHDMIGMVTVAQ